MARKTGSHSQTTGPLVRAAALRLFARSGYAAVSMRQIAAEVGMQAGALYLYTPDKQTLLFDLMREHLEDLLQNWRAVSTSDDPALKLESFCRFHIQYHLKRPEHVFIAYMELRNLEPANFGVIEVLRGKYEAELEAILSSGNTQGKFDIADAKLTTKAIIAMLNGVNVWYQEDGRLTRERVENIYWDLVRGAVGG